MLDSENFKFGILHDADNDGNFDPVQILDYDQLMQTFPLEPYGDYKPMK